MLFVVVSLLPFFMSKDSAKNNEIKKKRLTKTGTWNETKLGMNGNNDWNQCVIRWYCIIKVAKSDVEKMKLPKTQTERQREEK